MMSERKILWLIWLTRIAFLIGAIGQLFPGYVYTFVRHNMLKSYGSITLSLFFGMIFFSTFPAYRLHIRYNQIKKQISERYDFDHTLTTGTLMKKDDRSLINFIIILIIILAFIIFNFALGRNAYLNRDNLMLFFHMVFVIASILVFNIFLFIFFINENFNKLEGLVSQLKKDQTTEEKK